MLKRRKIKAATATNMRMFWLRPFIIFYITITIFLLFILIDECVLVWVSFDDRVIMDPDLDNIPSRTESLLGKPETGKFENDITSLPGLDSFEIHHLLLCVEYLGHLIETVTCHMCILQAGGVRTPDDILRQLLAEPSLTILMGCHEVLLINVSDLLDVRLGDDINDDIS